MKNVILFKGCHQASSDDIVRMFSRLEAIIIATQHLNGLIKSAPILIRTVVEEDKETIEGLLRLKKELSM